MTDTQFDFIYDELRPAAGNALQERWGDIAWDVTVGVDDGFATLQVGWVDGPAPAEVLDMIDAAPTTATVSVTYAGRRWDREVQVVVPERTAGPRLWLAALVEYHQTFDVPWQPNWMPANPADTPGSRVHGWDRVPAICDTISLTDGGPAGELWQVAATLAAGAGLLDADPTDPQMRYRLAVFLADAIPAATAVLGQPR